MEILIILISVLTAIVLILAFMGVLVFFKKRNDRAVYGGMEMEVFSVKMPRFEKKDDKQAEFKQIVGMMEQIYANFLYFKEDDPVKRALGEVPRISLEVASEIGGTNIIFYVAVPRKFEQALVKSIQGVYPGAVVEKIPQDYTIFEPNCQAVFSHLKLQSEVYFPLTTYASMQSDPLASITNALSRIKANEGAAIQIIIKPLEYDFRYSGTQRLNLITREAAMDRGQSSKLSSQYFLNAVSGERIFTENQYNPNNPNQKFNQGQYPYQSGQYPNQVMPPKEPDRLLMEAISNKIKKPAFDVNIRLVASAPDRARADFILQDLKSSFSQFLSAYNNFIFVDAKIKDLAKRSFDYVFRVFQKNQSIVLNSEELASVYHFPASHILSPNIKWAKVRETEPPDLLPELGDICIGKTVYRGEEKNVWYASEEDRRRHFYVVGQTGTGKSSLLYEMARQDIINGKGVGIIDPHGDLIEDILSIIPKERVDDVVLFEPADMDRPVGLNMLEWQTPEQKDFVVSEMISIFSKLFPPEIIGPMFEHYMRNAMLALMADQENPGTLVEIPRIFTDDKFMEERLSMVSDPLVRSFWLREWKQTVGQTKSDMLGYVVSKVGRFVENEMMRHIIGQEQSGFDLSEIMNNRKIFLANLSKGKTGEMNSSLLGLILVSKMQVAAMQRAKIPLSERQDFYLYVDEFHNFTTDNIATILSEARKYRLNLILAHQYIPQLQEQIKNAVMGNAGTIASFRVGVHDAEFLEKQFEPGFSRHDLVNLDNFYFLIKMMINNNMTSPFKAQTIKPFKGNRNIVEPIKKISKLKYGRPRELVEAEIAERWNF